MLMRQFFSSRIGDATSMKLYEEGDVELDVPSNVASCLCYFCESRTGKVIFESWLGRWRWVDGCHIILHMPRLQSYKPTTEKGAYLSKYGSTPRV